MNPTTYAPHHSVGSNPAANGLPLHKFIVDSVPEAVSQIRSQLGPQAIVLNVRRLPAHGLAKIWQKPRIEVIACDPQVAPTKERGETEAISELRREIVTLKQRFNGSSVEDSAGFEPEVEGPVPPVIPVEKSGWRSAGIMETAGLLPLHIERVVEEAQRLHGPLPPSSMTEEMAVVRRALRGLWRVPQPFVKESFRPHVLIGPPGAGKTTCLCKWLAQSILVEGHRARVWRLDGETANTAEALSIYAEILGVGSSRIWQVNDETIDADISFIDLPGTDWRSQEAMRKLGEQLKEYLSPRLHLVLNACYETPVLLAQARAFAALPLEGIILTHLDEESRWGKAWNLVLGTNYPVRYLSAGQNIPGQFLEADPELITDPFLPIK